MIVKGWLKSRSQTCPGFMSKKWSCATLGEGFRAVMEESAVEEESQILREIEDPSKSTHL